MAARDMDPCWVQIKQMYESGVDPTTLGQQFSKSRHAIMMRAGREKWKRVGIDYRDEKTKVVSIADHPTAELVRPKASTQWDEASAKHRAMAEIGVETIIDAWEHVRKILRDTPSKAIPLINQIANATKNIQQVERLAFSTEILVAQQNALSDEVATQSRGTHEKLAAMLKKVAHG